MERSRKMVVISHCLLNMNAMVEGLALNKGCAKDAEEYRYLYSVYGS